MERGGGRRGEEGADPFWGIPVADAPGSEHFEVRGKGGRTREGGEGLANDLDPFDGGPGGEGADAVRFQDSMAFY